MANKLDEVSSERTGPPSKSAAQDPCSYQNEHEVDIQEQDASSVSHQGQITKSTEPVPDVVENTGQNDRFLETADSNHDTSKNPRTTDMGQSMLNALKTAGHQDVLAIQRQMAERFKRLVSEDAAADGLGEIEPNKLGDDPHTEEFAGFRQDHLQKKGCNNMTVEEDVEYIQGSTDEEDRIRRLREVESSDPETSPNEDTLFFGQDSENSSESQSSDSENERSIPRGYSSKRKAEDDVDSDEAGAAKSKKARQSKTTNNKGGSSRNGKSTKKRRALVGMSNINIGNIFGTNVFADTAKVANLPDQPRLGDGKSRLDKLKDMTARLPEEDREKATTERNILDTAIGKYVPRRTSAASDGNLLLKGMKTTLKHYQMFGLCFLRKREKELPCSKREEEPSFGEGEKPHVGGGGILADQMGLGKTIMMLANLVNGKPPRSAPVKATLIVAAPALLNQWEDEINTHCMTTRENKRHGIGRVLRYVSSKCSPQDTKNLGQNFAVLTTYYEVTKSYPKAKPPPDCTSTAQIDEWWKDYFLKNRGLLHDIEWHRVVLDEAHAIKNHKSRTSRACRALKSQHKWAISGTPIMNTLDEFYPYFKFIQEPDTGSFEMFKSKFITPDDSTGTQKLQCALEKVMIRRTHVDQMFGARLLGLPQPSQHTAWLEFNAIERQIYEIVRKRIILKINAISKQEQDLEKSSAHIWTLLLRLRQLCAHVLLIQDTIMDVLEREDYELLRSITPGDDERNEDGEQMLSYLSMMFNQKVGLVKQQSGSGDAVLTTSQCRISEVLQVEETEAMGGAFGSNFRFKKYLRNLRDSEKFDEINERMRCISCKQNPEEPQLTSCMHIYCRVCLGDLKHRHARNGRDHAECLECGQTFESADPLDERNQADAEEAAASAPGRKKGAKNGPKTKEGNEDWIELGGPILSSAKTMAVKVRVWDWLKEDPKTKIIIYTQFLAVIRILAKICLAEKWRYVSYHGKMSQAARRNAIRDFGEKPEISIMIASLKCGGLGLNLTMAARVIIIDPWWNEAIEQQAFCRVFRHGQDKKTHLLRLVVSDTIDSSMMAVKEEKQIEIDEIMEDDKSKDRLSVREMMRLIGPVGKDSAGRPIILPDREDGGNERSHYSDED